MEKERERGDTRGFFFSVGGLRARLDKGKGNQTKKSTPETRWGPSRRQSDLDYNLAFVICLKTVNLFTHRYAESSDHGFLEQSVSK